jgi:hypothetical protein
MSAVPCSNKCTKNKHHTYHYSVQTVFHVDFSLTIYSESSYNKNLVMIKKKLVVIKKKIGYNEKLVMIKKNGYNEKLVMIKKNCL